MTTTTPSFRNARSGRGRSRKAKAFCPATAAKWCPVRNDIMILFEKKAHPPKPIRDPRRALEWFFGACLPQRIDVASGRQFLAVLTKLVLCIADGTGAPEYYRERPEADNVFVWLNKVVGFDQADQILWILRRALGRFHLVNLNGAEKNITSFTHVVLGSIFHHDRADGSRVMKAIETFESYSAACTPELHPYAKTLHEAVYYWLDSSVYDFTTGHVSFRGGIMIETIDRLEKLGYADTADALRISSDLDDVIREEEWTSSWKTIVEDPVMDALGSAMGGLGVVNPSKPEPVHRFDVGRFLNAEE